MWIIHWFETNPGVSGLSNAIQIGSGALAVYLWRKTRCHLPWCIRLGDMKVGQTHWRTCEKHSTHHGRLERVFYELHPHLDKRP